MPFLDSYYRYFYIIPVFQAICLIHSYRRGTLNNWLWLLVFIPGVGCIIYFFSEILPSRRRSIPKIDVGAIINPGARIKKMEETVRFSDTFANRIQLADAYLDGGQTEKAVEIYEASLAGAFSENEHVLAQLVIAYFKQQRYADAIRCAKIISKHAQFTRSQAHMYYARSLEENGDLAAAETEFKAMQGRFSYYEQRYEYALFLIRNNRPEDAEKILTAILYEEQQLSSMERKGARQWFNKAREEMKRV